MKINNKISIVAVVIAMFTLGLTTFTTQLDAQVRVSAPVGTLKLIDSETTTSSLTVEYSVDDTRNIMDGYYNGVAYSPTILVYENGATVPIETILIEDLSQDPHRLKINNLNPSTNYRIGLSVPYDLSGNDVADNETPYIITEINSAQTLANLPTATINQELSTSTNTSITVNFNFEDINNVATNLNAQLWSQNGSLVATKEIPIVADQDNYEVTFSEDLQQYQVYRINIVSDIDTNGSGISDIDNYVLDSELFQTDFNNLNPTGIIYDVDNGSSVTSTSIEVKYELIDYFQTIIEGPSNVYPRVVLENTDHEILSVEEAVVSAESPILKNTVTFDNLQPATDYNVYLSAQYDENGDGINDNPNDDLHVSKSVQFTTSVQ